MMREFQITMVSGAIFQNTIPENDLATLRRSIEAGAGSAVLHQPNGAEVMIKIAHVESMIVLKPGDVFLSDVKPSA